MLRFDFEAILYALSVWAIPAIVAITLHEAAHGFVAWYLGDDTAYQQGRVTLNPLRHIDRFGTIVLPAVLLILSQGRFGFGYAKPVPIAVGRLHRPRRDMVFVAAAGPAMNMVLALISAILLRVVLVLPLPLALGDWLAANLLHSILLNILLAVFNMLPLPPLDGGRVAVGLLPHALAFRLARLERYGLFILIAALFILPMIGEQIGVNLNVFRWLVWDPVQWILPAFTSIAGVSPGAVLP